MPLCYLNHFLQLWEKMIMIITGKVNMIIVNMINLDYITMAYQVPHETAKFCRDCGLVKEPLAIATDIAFQVDNYDGR